MCCEDVKIGRRTISVAQTINVLAGLYQVLPANQNRVGLVFLGANINTNCVGIIQPTGVTDGVRVNTTANYVDFNIWDHGDMVTKPWFGFGGAAGRLQLIETSLTGMCNDGEPEPSNISRQSIVGAKASG